MRRFNSFISRIFFQTFQVLTRAGCRQYREQIGDENTVENKTTLRHECPMIILQQRLLSTVNNDVILSQHYFSIIVSQKQVCKLRDYRMRSSHESKFSVKE